MWILWMFYPSSPYCLCAKTSPRHTLWYQLICMAMETKEGTLKCLKDTLNKQRITSREGALVAWSHSQQTTTHFKRGHSCCLKGALNIHELTSREEALVYLMCTPSKHMHNKQTTEWRIGRTSPLVRSNSHAHTQQNANAKKRKRILKDFKNFIREKCPL
jgi:hypothetical protein